MHWLIYTVVFLFGLIIGSFINCIVYRLHAKKSFLRGRSFCPLCKKQIAWYDNMPVLSYILLNGKCRHCHQPISMHYPLVELVSAILFVLVFWATFVSFSSFSPYLFSLILLRNWFFTFVLIIIFIYDLKYYLILDKVVLPAAVIALIFNLLIDYFGLSSFSFSMLANCLIAALVAGGFFLIQFVISRGKWIGGGDIRLGLLMGFMLGWPLVLLALGLSYIVGSLIALLLVFARKKTLKSQIPLGTFLSVGTLVSMLWGQQILAWYLAFTF